MRNNIKWIITFAAVILVCAAVWAGIFNYGSGGDTTAVITSEGKIVEEIDLNGVGEPYEFTVENGAGGTNVVRVENGRIAVVEASCPDKVCIESGFIENGSLPIVCLPNKLSVTISRTDKDDGEQPDIIVGRALK